MAFTSMVQDLICVCVSSFLILNMRLLIFDIVLLQGCACGVCDREPKELIKQSRFGYRLKNLRYRGYLVYSKLRAASVWWKTNANTKKVHLFFSIR